jgi:glyoxylase-like metal-dependent hydrolase (beta-lactamase superfamily II)
MEKKYRPIRITDNFYQLGTSAFPVYLSTGERLMLIEGGTSAISLLIIEQIKALGINPDSIKYLFLTHTHGDHIGALPYLRWLWPRLEVIASPIAETMLKSKSTIREFVHADHSIAEIMLAKREIKELPPEIKNPNFHVDETVDEGDTIDLGNGIVWTVHNTPGHSTCHTSIFEEKEKTLIIEDATGFYVPEKDAFWPNYFSSLKAYCESIKKLHSLSAVRGALSHNYVIADDTGKFLKKALKATEIYHHEMVDRLSAGESVDEIAMDKAKWVNNLTDDFTFEVMYTLAKVLIKRSQAEAHAKNLFDI